MKPVTIVIHPDEKAWSLREINLVRPPTHQWHRWQIVTVVRNDRLAEWWNDLGPSASFPVQQFEVPSLGEHTVGELLDIAEHSRLQDDYWQKRAVEITDGCTLIADFLDQKEERWRVINNQTVSGPLVTKQRDGFDKRAAQRRAG